MSGNNRAAIWLKRLVIAVCIGVVMLSAAIIAVRLGLTGAVEAALIALFVCLTVIFFVRQIFLRREVTAAKAVAAEAATTRKPMWAGKSGGFELLEPGASATDNALSAENFPDATTRPDKVPKKQVVSALGENDLMLFLQPIVTLPDKEPVFYQTLLRLKMADGTMLDPHQYQQAAQDGGLMDGIDRRSVIHSIRMLKTLNAMNKKAGLFCVLSPDSLRNGKSYDRIVSVLTKNHTVRNDLIIEVSQQTYASIGSAGRKRLRAVAELGFKLCMSELSDLRIDLDALSKTGFVYLKVPASILLGQQNDDEAIFPGTLAAHVTLRDMFLIATDVEQERQVPHLMDRDALIAQGNLFAEAKQVRAELLEED